MLDHQLLEDSEVVKAYRSEARGLCFRARIFVTDFTVGNVGYR